MKRLLIWIVLLLIIAVPVDAVPKVVAIPIAAVGPRVTTATPTPVPAAALAESFKQASS